MTRVLLYFCGFCVAVAVLVLVVEFLILTQ